MENGTLTSLLIRQRTSIPFDTGANDVTSSTISLGTLSHVVVSNVNLTWLDIGNIIVIEKAIYYWGGEI
jgi:hypothetical protein